MTRYIYWIFVASLILMVIVYYRGASSFVATFTGALVKLIYAVTGRDEQGHFVPYAGGA